VAEDDIYGALRYAGRDEPPLKALDTTGSPSISTAFQDRISRIPSRLMAA
jgi:DNA-binding transcriptional MocR family regulator